MQAENKEDDESKFDEFLGNDAGALAATGAYDDEDREADEVWEKLDERMDERRKVQRGGIVAKGAGFWESCLVDVMNKTAPVSYPHHPPPTHP